MKCIYFKIRSKKKKRYCYCTLKNKEVSFSCYQECDKKEYKTYKPIKKRTYKQAKKEKERFSIIYSDLSKCCVEDCNSAYKVSKNEVFEGAYRNRSIIYGAICPFCEDHHRKFHNDVSFNLKYKIMFQKELIKLYSRDWFIKTFGQDFEFRAKKRGSV